ncbi:MAG: hypothetical protein F6K00_19580 [Leptolyngbya sp. SIOISBB]|nr:hypothetical protein [Leptolyngbya sp. SIOISBB]
MKFQLQQKSFQVPSAIARHQKQWGFWNEINHVDPEPPSAPPPEPTPPNPSPTAPLQQPGLDALKAEREQVKQLQQQLKAFEGIDPAKYAEAMQIAQQQTEWAQQKSELETQYKNQYEPQIKQRDTEITQHKSALANYYADVAAEQAFLSADGIAGEFTAISPAVQQRMQVSTEKLEFDESGRLKPGSVSIQILDELGQPMFVDGKPATMTDLIKDLAKKNTWIARHFKGNNTPGFQLGGKSDFSSTNPSLSGVSAWDRVNMSRQGG